MHRRSDTLKWRKVYLLWFLPLEATLPLQNSRLNFVRQNRWFPVSEGSWEVSLTIVIFASEAWQAKICETFHFVKSLLILKLHFFQSVSFILLIKDSVDRYVFKKSFWYKSKACLPSIWTWCAESAGRLLGCGNYRLSKCFNPTINSVNLESNSLSATSNLWKVKRSCFTASKNV